MRKTWTVRLACVCAVVGLCAGSALADVTVMRQSIVDGMGGLLKSQTTSTESYSGDKMVTASETKSENKLIKMFGGGKPVQSTHITRLDKELMWDIDPKEKSYTEMTFVEMKAFMDSMGTLMSGATEPGMQTNSAIDTSKIAFEKPTFEVKHSGVHETIAGHECDQAILSMTTVGIDRTTGDTITLDLNLDLMLAKNVAGTQEIADFGARMAKAMGFASDAGSAQSMNKMLSMYGVDAERLGEEMKKLDGYPLKSVMSLSMGGSAMGKSAADSAHQSQQSGNQDGGAEAKKDDHEPSADPGSSIANALGGMFGKKDKKKDEAKEKPEARAAAPVGALLWISTTVTGIEQGPVSAERFEIPAGYKLEKSPLQKMSE